MTRIYWKRRNVRARKLSQSERFSRLFHGSQAAISPADYVLLLLLLLHCGSLLWLRRADYNVLRRRRLLEHISCANCISTFINQCQVTLTSCSIHLHCSSSNPHQSSSSSSSGSSGGVAGAPGSSMGSDAAK